MGGCFGSKRPSKAKQLGLQKDQILPGCELFWQGKYQDAIGQFRNVLDKSTSNHKAYNYIGLSMMMIGRYEEATFNFQKSLQINRNDALTYNNYGNLQMHRGFHIEAEQNFLKSRNLDPSNLMAISNLAYLKIKQCKYTQAIEILKDVPKGSMFPDSLMGLALIKNKQISEGNKYFVSVLKQKPSNDFDYMILGNASYYCGQLDKALAYYEAGLKINVHNYQIYQGQAQVLIKLGKIGQAIDCLNKSIQINPKSGESYYIMGCIHQENGLSNMARNFYDKAVEKNPQDKGAQECLIRISDIGPVKAVDGLLLEKGLQKQIERIVEIKNKQKREQQEQKKNCIICMTNKANCISGQCGHVASCFEVCGPKLKQCPTCRGKINIKKVYLNF